MSSPRLAGIPIDHIVAELAAFPLASEAAIEGGLTRLDPLLATSGPTSENSARLWRQAERHLLGEFPALGIDEIVAIRDIVWFAGDTGRAAPLHAYLRALADWTLETRGPTACPREPGQNRYVPVPGPDMSGPLARAQWRWMTIALPPDLLLAALDRNGAGPERVETISPVLSTHLADRGFAECHLHVGAGVDFPLLWTSALHAVARTDVGPAAFRGPGASMEQGSLLAPWLLRASIARYLLAGFLYGRNADEPFVAYLERVSQTLLWPELGELSFALLARSLQEVQDGSLTAGASERDYHAALQTCYRRLAGIGAQREFSTDAAARGADPIAPLIRQAGGDRRAPEVAFVAQALRYLEASATTERGEDRTFARLFWQVVRIRCLFYRHIVQRPMTPGLQWFVRFYGRLSPARRPLSLQTQVQSAARLCGAGRGLASLEIRTSPASSNSEILTLVADVETAGRPWSDSLEIGIVFHFTKDRGGSAREGLPTAYGRGHHADPQFDANTGQGENPFGYRYGAYYNGKVNEARRLTWLLAQFPLTLELVRALDVCTDELGVPNWVLAPILAEVREEGDRAAVRAGALYGVTLRGLATTVHAGEDFVHLLTGLRHVDEAIESYQLGSGDRIGHGIALGVDPVEWARRSGSVLMTYEDRMWDLLWEWSWYSRGGKCATASRTLYLERKLTWLAEQLFGASLRPYELEQLRADLFRLASLRQAGFPNGAEPGALPDAAEPECITRLRTYLTAPRVFANGRRHLWIDTGEEAAVLATLQAELRRKVATRGITVEVNPTSNLLIGNMGDLTTHPLWRLRPPRPLADAPPVSVCIGSDDPIVFASDLIGEYQALQDALVLGGLSEEEARQWLDRTRSAGMEARFTVPRRSGLSLFGDS